MDDDMNKKIRQIMEMLSQNGSGDGLKSIIEAVSSATSDKTGPQPGTSIPPPPGVNAGSSPAQSTSYSAQDAAFPQDSPGDSPLSAQPASSGHNNTGYESDDMMRKMRKLIDMAGPKDDPRSTLLMALRPYMNNKRQKRLSGYMKMMQLTRMLSMMDEFNGKNE